MIEKPGKTNVKTAKGPDNIDSIIVEEQHLTNLIDDSNQSENNRSKKQETKQPETTATKKTLPSANITNVQESSAKQAEKASEMHANSIIVRDYTTSDHKPIFSFENIDETKNESPGIFSINDNIGEETTKFMLSKTNQEDQNTLIIANESDTSTASTNEDNNGTFLLEVKKDTMIKKVIDGSLT